VPLSDTERSIPPGYQLDALIKGWPFQRAWHRARLDLIERLLPPSRGSLSLDLAAGAGIVTWRFQGCPIVSIDMRVDACRTIRDHTPGALAVASELGRLPFRSSTFSQIYFLETLEHLTSDEGRLVLEEMRRVSQSGSRCLVTTPNYRSHWLVLEWLLDACRLTPPLAGGQHISRCDGPALARIVEAAGWRILRRGSFNLIAPVVGMISKAAGDWAIDVEVERAGQAGALLYVLCEAPR
jgi:hypothetical protein